MSNKKQIQTYQGKTLLKMFIARGGKGATSQGEHCDCETLKDLAKKVLFYIELNNWLGQSGIGEGHDLRADQRMFPTQTICSHEEWYAGTG